MARFVLNKPVKTPRPGVVVDGGLPVGVHRFQLQVVTADGRTSRPDEIKVVISERRPGPLDPIRRDDNRE